MSLETKSNLNETTVEGLQKLIRYNIDACKGLQEASEKINDSVVCNLFQNVATKRESYADELKKHVEFSGEEAADEGSVLAAVHRAWINVRSAINGDNAYPVLCEAERGEDYIKGAYEDVLKESAGSPLNDILSKQYADVKSQHDQIRDLRDQYKN